MAQLFVVNGIRGGTLFPLVSSPLLVGRLPESDIPLGDAWISSQHARFEQRGAHTWIVDLQSSNGTFVDGKRVTEAMLTPGCRLRFGKTDVEFRLPAPPEGKGEQDLLRGSSTIMRSLDDLKAEALAARAPAAKRRTLGNVAAPPDPVQNAKRQVAVINELGKALIEAADLNSSLSAILRTTVDAVRAERSCLLLMDDAGELQPMAYAPSGVPPRLSNTLVETAMKTALANRAGILILDAQQDERFARSQSIHAEGIRSCMCVPIWGDNRILGMLVLDRSFADPFTADDLDLITMVGYQAALAIERMRFLERAQKSEDQRKRLLRHFSPDVANLILSQEQLDKDPLEISLRDEVTVLFSDVKGFTSMTERLPPLELGTLLREYFREMTEAIFEEGGTLDKFIGDGLMAEFGAPVAQADGAIRAVRCAWRMLARLDKLNRTLPEDRRITLRIGINTGRVLAGNIGSPERLEFTVLGDAVNTASRLESIATPGTIFVGKATAERASSTFDFKSLGPQQVKGKTFAVEVFELLGPRL